MGRGGSEVKKTFGGFHPTGEQSTGSDERTFLLP